MDRFWIQRVASRIVEPNFPLNSAVTLGNSCSREEVKAAAMKLVLGVHSPAFETVDHDWKRTARHFWEKVWEVVFWSCAGIRWRSSCAKGMSQGVSSIGFDDLVCPGTECRPPSVALTTMSRRSSLVVSFL